MGNRKNDIERYLRGELTPAEMHALEKEALQDPFLADALEGIDHTGANNFLFDLQDLNKTVRKRTRKKRIKVISMWGWPMGIAASLLFIAISGYMVISLIRQEKKQELATLNEKPVEQKSTSPSAADSLQAKDLDTKSAGEKETLASKPFKADQQIASSTSPKQKINEEAAGKKADVTTEPVTVPEIESDDVAEARTEEAVIAELQKPVPALSYKDSVVKEDKAEALERTASRAAAEKRARAAAPAYAAPNKKTIQGRVTSASDGSSLPGINVVVKGTNYGTVTDADGNFEINMPESFESLVFSFIGMQSKEVKVADQAELNVQLTEDTAQLSEVVVTGYGGAPGGSTQPETFELAEPAGGRRAFKNYLEKNVRYPEQALARRIEGRVTVQFTVQPNGSLTDFKVIKGIGAGCDEELIRLIKEGPGWSASKKNNQPFADQVKVRLKFNLPK